MFEITGEYTTAVVQGEKELFDETFFEQVQEIVNHEAFTGDVRIMSDGHAGSGAVIGFTMPVGEKVVPGTVGVDIGCGVAASNTGVEELPVTYAEADDLIRESVPFGRQVHDFDSAMHIGEEFPWERVNDRFEQFADSYEREFGTRIALEEHTPNGEYDLEYFKALCEKVGYNVNRAISSMGTLGGGNHFVEIARSENEGDLWIVLHSGSRGMGMAVAQYWQQRASDLRNMEESRQAVDALIEDGYGPYLKFDPVEVSDEDLYQWLTGGMGESFIREEQIRSAFDGEAINEAFERLKEAIPEGESKGNDLDYLAGQEAYGYFVDMLFAQQYAATSRQMMIARIYDALGLSTPLVSGESLPPVLDSPHNLIDFEDSVIRKGATRVHEGERAVIPFTMKHGSIIIEGKGNEEWNRSSPHGAGRAMSRTQAFEDLDLEDYEHLMDGIYSTSVTAETLDESPQSYKDPALIEQAMSETATVVDRLVPEHSLKAEN